MKEILLFGKALNTQNVSAFTVNELAIKKGYVVDPKCCNQRVVDFLVSLPNNYNTTFYRSVADVVERTRYELLVDQILHYASTYGSEYTATPYIVNDNFGEDTDVCIDFSECKVIKPITQLEIGIKVQDMLESGIALKEDTLDNLFDLITEFDFQIDINVVKNIEAKMRLHALLDILPNSADEMVRFVVYQITGDTLLIKNKELIAKISLNYMNTSMVTIHNQMVKFGLEELSSVFFRYKPFFLALRKDALMRKLVNKLRKLANKHHKPFVAGYWETILTKKDFNVQELMSKVKSLSNFKLVRLIKAIDVKSSCSASKFFLIRNGKTFIKENNDIIVPSRLLWMRDIFMESLADNIREKQLGRVKLPTNLRLAVPTSEKTYVGNIPFGSYIIPSKSNSIFGINWFGNDGAQDLDLSYIGLSGQKVGWNSKFYSGEKDIIYSGDMTRANPEACEYMFCKNGLEDGVIYVNAYNANPNSKYRFFVGQTNNDFTVSRETPSESMIDFSAPMSITGEQCVGFYVDGRIYFSDLNQGGGRVSNFTIKTKDMVQYFVDTKDAFVYWDEILTLAGCKVVVDDEECDVDLSDGDVSTMISLLS
jgi:uncharacterized coiled-coil protein SlyX